MNTTELCKRLLSCSDGEDIIAVAARIIQGCLNAGFVTDDGKVRQVTGSLPLTDDGVIGGSGAEVWTINDGKIYTCRLGMVGSLGINIIVAGTTRCYSTRAAAEAALSGGVA